jgi:hypothetical protein
MDEFLLSLREDESVEMRARSCRKKHEGNLVITNFQVAFFTDDPKRQEKTGFMFRLSAISECSASVRKPDMPPAVQIVLKEASNKVVFRVMDAEGGEGDEAWTVCYALRDCLQQLLKKEQASGASGGGSASAQMFVKGTTHTTEAISELDVRLSLLAKNDALREEHRALVTNEKIVSDGEFWANRRELIERERSELAGKARGFNSAFADVHESTGAQGHKIYKLTVEDRELILAEYPKVKELYLRDVPHKLSEERFWQKFLLSRLYVKNFNKIRRGVSSGEFSLENIVEEEERTMQSARAAIPDTMESVEAQAMKTIDFSPPDRVSRPEYALPPEWKGMPEVASMAPSQRRAHKDRECMFRKINHHGHVVLKHGPGIVVASMSTGTLNEDLHEVTAPEYIPLQLRASEHPETPMHGEDDNDNRASESESSRSRKKQKVEKVKVGKKEAPSVKTWPQSNGGALSLGWSPSAACSALTSFSQQCNLHADEAAMRPTHPQQSSGPTAVARNSQSNVSAAHYQLYSGLFKKAIEVIRLLWSIHCGPIISKVAWEKSDALVLQLNKLDEAAKTLKDGVDPVERVEISGLVDPLLRQIDSIRKRIETSWQKSQ